MLGEAPSARLLRFGRPIQLLDLHCDSGYSLFRSEQATQKETCRVSLMLRQDQAHPPVSGYGIHILRTARGKARLALEPGANLDQLSTVARTVPLLSRPKGSVIRALMTCVEE